MREIKLSFLILIVTISAFARVVETDEVSHPAPPASKWESFKAAVVNWWNNDSKPQERAPASVATAQPNAAETKSMAETKPDFSAQAKELPSYSTKSERETQTQKVSQSLAEVRSIKPVRVEKAGTAADASLPKTKSGVVSISLKNVSKIPALNVGTEDQITSEKWQVQPIETLLAGFAEPKALKSPELVSESDIKTAMGAQPEKVEDAAKLKVTAFEDDGRVSLDTVRKVQMKLASETPITLKDVKMLSDEELKLLKAQILLESGKKCHAATGFLAELTKSENAEVRVDANFQLAMCLHQMGLYTDSIKRMKDVFASGRSENIKAALRVLVKDLPKEEEADVADELKKISDMNLVPEESRDAYHYIIAKAAAREDHFSTAYDHAEKVSKKFEKYPNAQFVLAVSEYALDKRKQALDRFRSLKTYIEQNGGDKDLLALISLNLARTAFQDKDFKGAIENYHDIKKDHPLWVDALIEQGWTQLLVGDNSGAIGNMYSIHSPYFKSVYQPESYVVRSIGYLNICQYGDSYRTLSQLEQTYRAWYDQVSAYRKKSKGADTYTSLIKYLKSGTSQANIDGLPYQVMREIGRHKDFLNLQEGVNARVDEVEQFNFISGLISKDKANAKWYIKKSLERLQDMKLRLAKAEKDARLAGSINEIKRQKKNEEAVLEALEFEYQVYDDSLKAFTTYQKSATARVNSRKAELQQAANEILKSRLKKVEQKLASVLDNNELLRYEVFAGSGENIRYQSAGGETGSEKRVARTVKPESKALQWQFDGEYWEDEIGHYRSSLRDNCPTSKTAAR